MDSASGPILGSQSLECEVLMTSLINILLVDDHYILREGVKTLLESDPDVRVIACAATATDGLAKAIGSNVHVALIDYSLPDHNGLWLLQQIRTHKPALPVIILSMHTDRETVMKALSEGASGYLTKSVETSELLAAIRAVHQGGSYLHPTIAPHLLGAIRKETTTSSTTDFNLRELRILQHTADGWSNQRIADELFLSTSTIKSDLRALFQKLKVSTRTEAVAEAMRRGLVVRS